jgi:hypothetical protein
MKLLIMQFSFKEPTRNNSRRLYPVIDFLNIWNLYLSLNLRDRASNYMTSLYICPSPGYTYMQRPTSIYICMYTNRAHK